MDSLNRIGTRSISLPISADDLIEFHAARLLLLIKICGVAGRMDGLTKMAKMDFFARYPDFFAVAKEAAKPAKQPAERESGSSDEVVESAMIRHHYGPWDKRYYQVLAVLEAKGLVTITKQGRSYQIALTSLGDQRAKNISSKPSFEPLVLRMKDIKKTFGTKSGNSLKELIYRLFDTEVGQRQRGEVIE